MVIGADILFIETRLLKEKGSSFHHPRRNNFLQLDWGLVAHINGAPAGCLLSKEGVVGYNGHMRKLLQALCQLEPEGRHLLVVPRLPTRPPGVKSRTPDMRTSNGLKQCHQELISPCLFLRSTLLCVSFMSGRTSPHGTPACICFPWAGHCCPWTKHSGQENDKANC